MLQAAVTTARINQRVNVASMAAARDASLKMASISSRPRSRFFAALILSRIALHGILHQVMAVGK